MVRKLYAHVRRGRCSEFFKRIYTKAASVDAFFRFLLCKRRSSESATSRSRDRSKTASASAEKSRPNSLTVSRCADLAGSPSAPLAKLSRKLASASLTPRPIIPSDGVFAIVRWSISTRLCRRSPSPWSAAAISASRACNHSRHHLSNSTSSFVVKCDFWDTPYAYSQARALCPRRG